MVMTHELATRFARDRDTWDACAEVYEEAIVCGHPDVTAYEAFEEDLLDRLLGYLARDRGLDLSLFDVGCGSARLHIRYGLKTAVDEHETDGELSGALGRSRILNQGCQHDPVLARRLLSVGGVDFSANMVRMARDKLRAVGLTGDRSATPCRLSVSQGSAFDLTSLGTEGLPIAVAVCNTVGVMQGPEGARELFRAMRRAVEEDGGIAIISGYRKDAIPTYALGNYESTMNVCGQPRWLTPDTYAGSGYIQIPREYKRAYDPTPTITVDVLSESGQNVASGQVLERCPERVAETVRSGHIKTHTDYESRWYSCEQFRTWLSSLWPSAAGRHVEGRELDALRGSPAQLAVLDPQHLLDEFWERRGQNV